jgi:hypothetical protein
LLENGLTGGVSLSHEKKIARPFVFFKSHPEQAFRGPDGGLIIRRNPRAVS